MFEPVKDWAGQSNRKTLIIIPVLELLIMVEIRYYIFLPLDNFTRVYTILKKKILFYEIQPIVGLIHIDNTNAFLLYNRCIKSSLKKNIV